MLVSRASDDVSFRSSLAPSSARRRDSGPRDEGRDETYDSYLFLSEDELELREESTVEGEEILY